MTSRQLSQKLDLVMKRVSTANVTFGRSGLLAKKCDDIQWFTKSEFFRTSQVLSHNPQRNCCKYLLNVFDCTTQEYTLERAESTCIR